jgi:hypothetical protein
LGTNVTFVKNTAKSGGDNAYLADAAAANSWLENSTEQANPTRPAPSAILQGSGQCTQQDLNKADSTRKIAGPPCGLVLWSPAAGTQLPYVNNGSGLPTINATVVDCWCSRVHQIPGEEECHFHLVQALPEHPVGSQQGSWVIRVITRMRVDVITAIIGDDDGTFSHQLL